MSGNNDAASDSRFLSCISFRAVKSSFDMYSPLRGEELPSVVISCQPTVNPTWRASGTLEYPRSSWRISPWLSQTSFSGSMSTLQARALLKAMPLMPPADVPPMISMLTDNLGPVALMPRSASK